ncbi:MULTISPECIES: hypothetical protein [unclassified Hyphomicrobium]|uniref:hypothetical protein n=1 Tax=unclassified Hyphomicrobium TaxID=2619925 RepID=UPI000213DFC2|nr:MULTISPECIES: hypothetical protein [unclassified Hyphomicrobium]CCB66422.1 conserved protein of unknown function; putative membrane protein [Hyphomicrobium sp. MC1]
MSTQYAEISAVTEERWLKQYYFIRGAFSVLWVGLALTAGQQGGAIAAALLIIYPAWDALANYVDAARSGGLGQNRTQAINVFVSVATAAAVVVSLQSGMSEVLGAFGVWAILAGLLQLGTALGRWKTYGAQWAMVLSGAQSAVAGGLFISRSTMATPHSISDIAGYAGVGAVYFLISAGWLAVRDWRNKAA